MNNANEQLSVKPNDEPIVDELDKEPRGFLDRLNQFFSRNEPKIGFGKNVIPIVPVQPVQQIPYATGGDSLQASTMQDSVWNRLTEKSYFGFLGNFDQFFGHFLVIFQVNCKPKDL